MSGNHDPVNVHGVLLGNPGEHDQAGAVPTAPGPAAGLGELGRTTSSRGWLALVALLLVIIGFTIWGLFGTIPVQTTIPATVTNGVAPRQITAGVQGTVASLLRPKAGGDGTAGGTELMAITPRAGGPDVAVKAPVDMGVALDVILGSPVEPGTVVAVGVPTNEPSTDTGTAQVYAFLSSDIVESLKTAEKLSVTPLSPDLAVPRRRSASCSSAPFRKASPTSPSSPGTRSTPRTHTPLRAAPPTA